MEWSGKLADETVSTFLVLTANEFWKSGIIFSDEHVGNGDFLLQF
jgi:hypothetical protein